VVTATAISNAVGTTRGVGDAAANKGIGNAAANEGVFTHEYETEKVEKEIDSTDQKHFDESAPKSSNEKNWFLVNVEAVYRMRNPAKLKPENKA